jgi:hypothetical protein
MLKEHLELLGINPKIIHQYLSECLDATKAVNEELVADLDPIAYQRNQLTITEAKLLLIYLA